jgi:hypothetical protein
MISCVFGTFFFKVVLSKPAKQNAKKIQVNFNFFSSTDFIY